MTTYFDTSAPVKRYVAAHGSDAIEAFIADQPDDCVISPPGATEFESVLQRLQAGDLLRGLKMPLKTLDALRLASGLESRCAALATADRRLADAAAAAGLNVNSF